MPTIRLSRLFLLLAASLLAALAAIGYAAAAASAPATRADNSAAHTKNLKAIGQILAIYSAQWNDRLPTGMEVLIRQGADFPATFVQALTGPEASMPADIAAGTPAQKAAWLEKNGSYRILGLAGGRFSVLDASKAPLAIQRPDLDKTSPKLGVLYHDGHVELRDRAEVEAMVPKPATATAPKP